MSASTEFDTLPPIQTEIRRVTGSPEGEIAAPAGYLVADTNGNLYLKQSGPDLDTGWVLVSTEAIP